MSSTVVENCFRCFESLLPNDLLFYKVLLVCQFPFNPPESSGTMDTLFTLLLKCLWVISAGWLLPESLLSCVCSALLLCLLCYAFVSALQLGFCVCSATKLVCLLCY